jgi:hypothetical protein
MPSSAPQIPAAVEAIAKARWERDRLIAPATPRWTALSEVSQRAFLAQAGDDLEAVYPHLLAAFLDSLEEREEWRVVVNEPQGERDHGPFKNLERAQVLAEEEDDRGRRATARIQSRTVTETPWTDVEEGTDGC